MPPFLTLADAATLRGYDTLTIDAADLFSSLMSLLR